MRSAVYALPALVAALSGSASAEEIGVRTGEHPGHGRLVLEWSAPVAVEAKHVGDSLNLDFGRAVDAVDLSVALDGLPDHLQGFAPGEGLDEMVLRLAPGVRPHVWSVDSRTIIDFYETASGPPPVPVRIGGEDGMRRLVFDWDEPVPFTVSERNGIVAITFGAPARLDPDSIAAGLVGLASDARTRTGETWSWLELDLVRPVAVTGRSFDDGRVQIDLALP